eukprot:COSAG04_NODE_420_length_14643_cov_3.634007_3_plen_180_part_00
MRSPSSPRSPGRTRRDMEELKDFEVLEHSSRRYRLLLVLNVALLVAVCFLAGAFAKDHNAQVERHEVLQRRIDKLEMQAADVAVDVASVRSKTGCIRHISAMENVRLAEALDDCKRIEAECTDDRSQLMSQSQGAEEAYTRQSEELEECLALVASLENDKAMAAAGEGGGGSGSPTGGV